MEHSLDVSGREEDVHVKAQKDRLVSEDEWLQKWQTNNIAFHIEQGHLYVVLYSSYAFL